MQSRDDSDGLAAADRLGPQLVRAVARARGVDPMELQPVHESVDVEALSTLFRPDAGGQQDDFASFTVARCDVTVFASGRIDVEPPDADPARGSTRRSDGGVDGS